MSKANRLSLKVNEMEYTDDSRRKALTCEGCKQPTTGRVKEKPYCMDCAMKVIMKPLTSARETLQEVFGDLLR